jgi:hypothetical protein
MDALRGGDKHPFDIDAFWDEQVSLGRQFRPISIPIEPLIKMETNGEVIDLVTDSPPHISSAENPEANNRDDEFLQKGNEQGQEDANSTSGTRRKLLPNVDKIQNGERELQAQTPTANNKMDSYAPQNDDSPEKKDLVEIQENEPHTQTGWKWRDHKFGSKMNHSNLVANIKMEAGKAHAAAILPSVPAYNQTRVVGKKSRIFTGSFAPHDKDRTNHELESTPESDEDATAISHRKRRRIRLKAKEEAYSQDNDTVAVSSYKQDFCIGSDHDIPVPLQRHGYNAHMTIPARHPQDDNSADGNGVADLASRRDRLRLSKESNTLAKEDDHVLSCLEEARHEHGDDGTNMEQADSSNEKSGHMIPEVNGQIARQGDLLEDLAQNTGSLPDSPVVARTKKPKQKRKRIHNAAEFFAREAAREGEKKQKALQRELAKQERQAKKRPASSKLGHPSSKRRMIATSKPRAKTARRRLRRVASESPGTSVAEMVEEYDAIGKRVKQEQISTASISLNVVGARNNDQYFKGMKEILEKVPDGYDTRRMATQLKDLQTGTRAFGHGMVTKIGDRYLVKGMKSALLDSQLTVASWMLNRELSGTVPIGGILADVMGMGKTIVSLACIIGNPPTEKLMTAGKGTTLVIVPSSQVVAQWMEQVKIHCDRDFSKKILHYKASNQMDIDIITSMSIM